MVANKKPAPDVADGADRPGEATLKVSRGRNPASKKALSKKQPPNPPGLTSRSHNIKAPASVHERFAALDAAQRGQLVEAALKTGLPDPEKA